MQYRNRILIGYFIGIVLIIVSDKYNFLGFNVPKVLRETIYIYATLSLIGIILAVIPIRRNRILKWMGIIGNIGIYIFRFKNGLQCNTIVSIILLIVFVIIEIILYWSYDNAAVLSQKQGYVNYLVEKYEIENSAYDQEVKKLNELEQYWLQLDEKLGIGKSLKNFLKEKLNISDDIEITRDIKRKYPLIDAKQIIGLAALWPDSSSLDKMIKDLEKYQNWLEKNENKIRFRAHIIEQRISELESQISHVEDSLHKDLDERLIKKFNLDKSAQNIKKRYNTINKTKSKIKKRI